MAVYTAIDNPELYFQTKLYTGNGTDDTAITLDGDENMQPDWVWIKNRSAADNHFIFDAPRGVTKYWIPDTHSIEATNVNSLTSFDSDGFGLGTGAGGFNDDTENFVAWQWLAGGGAGSSNEWIELYNNFYTPLNLETWILSGSGGGETVTLSTDIVIPPKDV